MMPRWLADLSSLSARRGPLAFAGLVLVADQISKWWIVDHVMVRPQVIEVTPFFNIVMTWNRGVTFGMLASDGETTRWLLIGVSLAVVGVLLVWLARTAARLPAFALAAVIGGALGNVIDRLNYGKVADFLDFHLAGWHWPAFNLADSAIVCGVVLLLLDTFTSRAE
jgi:signal peptidase II